MKLAVGDAVVYAAHGSGRVLARERKTILGVEQEVVVLELAHGLCVTLPIRRARERLRPVASEADVQRVQKTLHENGEANDDGWLKRLKQGQAKLASGDPLELAEIVRDGMRLDGSLAARGTKPKLSESERRLYVKARQLLAQEIGSARGLVRGEADAWIEEQVAPAGSEKPWLDAGGRRVSGGSGDASMFVKRPGASPRVGGRGGGRGSA